MTANTVRSDTDVMFLEIAVAAPLWQTLTYSVRLHDCSGKRDLKDSSFVGKRVLVPLGRQRVMGYVLSTPNECDGDFKVKPIIDLIDSKPLFHANIIEFFRWISNYYHYPIGQVIKTALPGGLTRKSGKRLEVGDSDIDAELEWSNSSLAEPEWFSTLKTKGCLSISATRKALADKKSKKIIHDFVDKGKLILDEHLQHEATKEKREVCYCVMNGHHQLKNMSNKNFDLLSYTSWLKGTGITKLSTPELKSLYYLERLGRDKKNRLVPARDLRKRYSGSSAKILNGLVEKDLIKEEKTRVYRNPFGDQLVHVDRPDQLTDEQRRVLGEIIPAVQEKSYKPFLLHGVTGCGKTEVYLQSAEKTLATGRDVLVLVPEIALATQLEAAFVSRFGDKVVLLHSGLSPGEKFDQWETAAIGKAKVVIGARSALFAPLKDPGLIVVDEEHDPGFKQGDGFRYQARDLALLRGKFQHSVVLLGSATPSITSYHHAKSGKFALLSMEKRVADRPLPMVQIVDMSEQQRKGIKKLFSNELKLHLSLNLERSKQSLLLLNRRGFSAMMMCEECGTVVQCQHCHVSLTYHKQKKSLICHYCGFQLTAKVICNNCQCDSLITVGYGTERVEEELSELLPHARIERLDSDSASDRRQYLQILKKMRDREIDILIGTQMIAKGHHFPHVTLVGVVWADGGLSMPDFKASERTFQLLSQVTGRAGRGDHAGEVIIQTLHPEHYAIVYSQKHTYEDLYNKEIAIRESTGFPPFSRMINIRLKSEEEFDARQSAAKIGTFCKKMIHSQTSRMMPVTKNGLRVLGPAPAPIDRLRGQYRWQLLLKGAEVAQLRSLCQQVIDKQKELLVGKAILEVDVDPENMM